MYEVSDEWDESIDGYIVPSSIAEIASQYKHGLGTEGWNLFPLHKRNTLKHAHRLLDERFPRMSAIAAIRIAERAEWERWNGEKKSLEEKVVNHVRHEWTSYEVRLAYAKKYDRSPTAWSGGAQDVDVRWREHDWQAGAKKDQILEAIKPRMREVLHSWPQDMDEFELTKFWRRHRLQDSVSGESGVSQRAALQHFGGMETVANLISRVDVIS